MYREEVIQGKGVGCLATRDIEPGVLVVREAPCLYIDPEEAGQGGSVLKRTITAFINMNKEDKTQYMELSNMFDRSPEEWSVTARKDMKTMKQELNGLILTRISVEEAVKVWQIKITNSFHNGVCLKISRFNHSCWPNAEYFWNSDTKTRDVRSVAKITQGDEISLDYRRLWTLTRRQRRKCLKEDFNFDCCCLGCVRDEKYIQEENQMCESFVLLHNEHQTIENTTQDELMRVVSILKDMYKLAKSMKIIKQSLILNFIVEDWFVTSCVGLKNAANETEANTCSENIQQSLLIGIALSNMLYGSNYSSSEKWRNRESNLAENKQTN